jgi:hypothetical protein
MKLDKAKCTALENGYTIDDNKNMKITNCAVNMNATAEGFQKFFITSFSNIILRDKNRQLT